MPQIIQYVTGFKFCVMINEDGLETSFLDADGEESAMEGSTIVASDPRQKKRKRSRNYRQFQDNDSPNALVQENLKTSFERKGKMQATCSNLMIFSIQTLKR